MAHTSQFSATDHSAKSRVQPDSEKRGGYSRHWENNGKALADDNDARDLRKSQYTDVVNDYYDLTTDIYLESWGQSFHNCRFPRGSEDKAVAIARHQHYLAHMMSLRSGMRVLDVGCGVGGPAKEMITFAGCEVVGLNNNAYQVKKGRELAKQDGLETKVELVKGDFMDMPFGANEFDAAYAIEATVHAPSLAEVYAQVFRVLKPGGVFGVYEWVLTDSFSPDDKDHMAVRLGIERGNGIPALQTAATARAAMESAGFELLIAEDLAANKDPLPWWYPFSGDVKSANSVKDWTLVVRNTEWGRVVVKLLVRALEFVQYAPAGTLSMTEDLIVAADSLIAGGKEGIFTPMYLMVGRKPNA